MTGLSHGQRAREQIDRVLAQRPDKDGTALSEASLQLCIYREMLIDEAAAGGASERERLSHLNAILSVVAAVHFPLGTVPWEELVKARGWLTGLLERGAANADVRE